MRSEKSDTVKTGATCTARRLDRRGEREDALADSVTKTDAAAIKPGRLGAKPWRTQEDSATDPECASRTPKGGDVGLAERIALTPFSTPVVERESRNSGSGRPGAVQ